MAPFMPGSVAINAPFSATESSGYFSGLSLKMALVMINTDWLNRV